MQQILMAKILQKSFQLLAKSEIILYVDLNEKQSFFYPTAKIHNKKGFI